MQGGEKLEKSSREWSRGEGIRRVGSGVSFPGVDWQVGVAARTAPTDVHPGLLEKPVPSTTIGSRSRLER